MASGPITSWEIDGETVETVTDFILGGSKITADADCSHEIKRHLILGRNVMTNLDNILKSRNIILPTKVHLISSVDSVMSYSHLILCHPLLLLPSIFLSIRVFSIESVLHIRWPKYWTFSFRISPSNEYAGLISFGINWFVSLQSKGLSQYFQVLCHCQKFWD